MSKAQTTVDMDKDTSKTTVTISEETRNWLETEYPDALSLQEAIRSAISDARVHRTVISSSSVSLNQDKD